MPHLPRKPQGALPVDKEYDAFTHAYSDNQLLIYARLNMSGLKKSYDLYLLIMMLGEATKHKNTRIRSEVGRF